MLTSKPISGRVCVRLIAWRGIGHVVPVQERCAIIACLSGGYQPSRRLECEKSVSGGRLQWPSANWQMAARPAFGEVKRLILK